MKIASFYLRTGGGHYAPARAVAESVVRSSGGRVETVLIDGLAESPRWTRMLIEDGYGFLQSHARWYYAFLYWISQAWVIGYCWTAVVSLLVRPSIERRILAERPARIVVYHFFLIKPVLDALQSIGKSIPVVVVVTDPYTAHPVWFLRQGPRFVVFSERLKTYALRRGINEEQLSVFPGIANDKFALEIDIKDAARLRNSLGLSGAERIVLLIGGKDGIPNGFRLVRELARSKPSYAVVAVCGQNQALRRRLESLKAQTGWENLIVLGHSDDVHALLSIADLVVTKCGASICLEVLMAKRIPIVHRYLWGQEQGNLDFLTRNNLGFHEPAVGGVARRIELLLEKPELREAIASNIAGAGIRNGGPLVAQMLLEAVPDAPAEAVSSGRFPQAGQLSLAHA